MKSKKPRTLLIVLSVTLPFSIFYNMSKEFVKYSMCLPVTRYLTIVKLQTKTRFKMNVLNQQRKPFRNLSCGFTAAISPILRFESVLTR